VQTVKEDLLAGTKVPVDISAVKKYGVNKWRGEFFWPVSDAEFVTLSQAVEGCMRSHITEGPEKTRDLFLIQAGIRTEYWHFLHAAIVKDRLKREALEPLYTEKTLWYSSDAPMSFTERGKNSGKAPSLKDHIAPFVRSVAYNSLLAQFKNSVSGKVFVYGSVNELMAEYIKSDPRLFVFRRPPHTCTCRSKTDVAAYKKEAEKITEDLSAIARGHDVDLDDTQREYLHSFTVSALEHASTAYCGADREVKNLPSNIIVSGLGNIRVRALCVAARKSGVKVTGFSHGGNIGLYDTPYLAFSEFALTDRFITYTGESAELFCRIQKMHPDLTERRTRILDYGSTYYKRIYEKKRCSPIPSSIRRVMLIGYPHNQWRKPQSSGGFSLFHLDLEIRLCELLKKNGYEVVYKAHPDRLSEIEGVFDIIAEVRTEPFQECMDEADAYLFGSIRTTAFPMALCTNKPVIGLVNDEGPYKAFGEPMEILRKRCYLAETGFDEKNRFLFNKGGILNYLKNPDNTDNTDFLENYMFSK